MNGAEPALLTLAGDLDLSAAEGIAALVASVRNRPFVILDLTAVTFLDSLAMMELMRAHANASGQDGAIAIVAPDERISRSLSIAGVTRIARIFDTVEHAREHLDLLAS